MHSSTNAHGADAHMRHGSAPALASHLCMISISAWPDGVHVPPEHLRTRQTLTCAMGSTGTGKPSVHFQYQCMARWCACTS